MMELDNCPCSGANLPRFVQPVILAVLSSGPLHGYLVVQRLAETSLFRKQPPDATGVYRMLRNMEQEGVLESDWELENSGPARKRYTLTEKGGHCLDQWMRTLTSHQAFIANLLLFLQDARSGMNSEPCPMTLSQLTIIDKLEVIAFCQYSDKLSSYIADTHFQMW